MKAPTRKCRIKTIEAIPSAVDMTNDTRNLRDLTSGGGIVAVPRSDVSVSNRSGSIRGGVDLAGLLPSGIGLADSSDRSM